MTVRTFGVTPHNYTVGTLTIDYAIPGPMTINEGNVPMTKPSGRKINHALSNLPDATVRSPELTLTQAIERGSKGEFGHTEVPPNQIW
jgi:hypothetical protein